MDSKNRKAVEQSRFHEGSLVGWAFMMWMCGKGEFFMDTY